MATDFVKKWQTPIFVALVFREEWDNAVYMHDLIAPLMPLYRVKFW